MTGKLLAPLIAIAALLLGTQPAAQQETSKQPSPAATAASIGAEHVGVEPHIVLETVGPDGWRMRLGVTNVAAMLDSEEGREVWQPRLEPILGIWKMMVGDEEAFAAASKRIFSYGGTIRIAVFINPAAAAHVAVMLEPDGRSDLKAIAADIKSLVERSIPGEWQTVTIGGKQITLRGDTVDAVTAPVLENGRLYMVAGDQKTIHAGIGLATHLMARPLTITTPKPTSPALHISVNMPALLALDDDPDTIKIHKALGFSQLQELSFAVRAAGPRIEVDVSARLKGAARGIVKAFAPDSPGVSALSQLLPEKATVWKVGRFDGRAFFNGCVDAIAASGWGKTREETLAEINKECGTDVDGELLANLSDEMLVVGSPFQNFDRLNEATWLVGFRVKNTAKFRTSFQAMMKKMKWLFSGSETVDVDGIELRRYGNMIGYDVWMAVGNGLFVISAGRDAEEEATTILQKAKDHKFEAATELAASHQDLNRYLPPALNGVAQADLGSALAIPSEWWVELVNELMPFLAGPKVDPDEAEEQQQKMLKLLKTHNLELVRSATGFANDSWQWRLFW
tara:strand:+ start:3032 stop:4735 length:1704 start_codon:yes stop_codon:yes gene_type:complete